MNDLTALETQFKKLQEIGLNSLKRSELGVFNFESVFPHLQEMHSQLSFFVDNKELLKNHISQEHVDQIKAKIERFIRLAEDLKKFDPTSINDPNSQKTNLSNQVISVQKETSRDLLNLYTYLLVQKIKPEEISKGLELQKKEVNKVVREIENKNKEAEEVLTKIKEISGNVGATVYSEVFKNQANKHRVFADRWFIGAIGVFVAIIAYLTYLLIFGKLITDQSIEIIIQNAFVKILFLSTLFYALYQCIRNYNANMHLQVLNQHRQNAIETFEAFANAAPTPEVKSAVLMQATKSIFEFNKSGYLSKDNPSGSAFNLVDFLHSFGNK